ncbi:MAG: GTPase ObgE [Candidatus Saccharimonadales bacterium]
MSFVDKVEVSVIAGKGGDGHRSFRRERFIAKGGPDGGDGGNGGDIVFRANANQDTLSAFRHKKLLVAANGQPGGKSRKHGKSGENLIIDVPLGTEVRNSQKQIIADLVMPSEEIVIAKGGKGGFGNAHFTSSTRQAPNFAEKGETGEKLELTLELKLIADVGLVGLPNAGKSTLLSRLSNARPEIADYPFTTLTPNLGVVDVDNQTSILLADIPGLIEGASTGKGLGHEFLRHIERTKLIVHLIDIYEEDIAISYKTIRKELSDYSQKLGKLPELVVINKIDGYDPKILKTKINQLKKAMAKNTQLLMVSAKAGTNLDELKFKLKDMLLTLRPTKESKLKPVIPRITLEDVSGAYEVIKTKDGFRISGPRLEQFAARTDFNNLEAVDRFKHILSRMGILHELTRQGLKPGSRIYVGKDSNNCFTY